MLIVGMIIDRVKVETINSFSSSASVVHSFNIGSREKDASPKSRKSISFPGKKAIHCVEEGKKGSAFGIYLSKKDTFKRAWQGTKLLLSRDSKKHWRMLARHIY